MYFVTSSMFNFASDDCFPITVERGFGFGGSSGFDETAVAVVIGGNKFGSPLATGAACLRLVCVVNSNNLSKLSSILKHNNK